jgi:polysaccharide pyruvyl transferase WcaK-like protein
MDIEIFTGKDAVDAVGLEAGQGRRDKRGSKRVWILDRELPPQALIALMGELDMLIATRLHALILATVAGTPSIGIAYRSKVRAIFADNGRERWTVSPEEPDWPEKMLDLWREMAERLAEERQAVRRMADANRRAAREQTAALGRWVRSGAAGAEGGTS